MMSAPVRSFGCLAFAVTYTLHSEAWIPAQQLRVLRARAPLPSACSLLQHRPTALGISRRDLSALRGDSDEDPEERAAAAAAAEAARNMLEKMWTSSEASDAETPTNEEEPAVKLQQAAAGRQENIFPSSSERGALEAAAACRKALLDGKRGLIIDVEVKQLEEIHPEFDPNLLVHFVGEVAKSLATMIGCVKIMYKGDNVVQAANKAWKGSNEEAIARGMDPRDDVTCCSYISQVNPEDQGYFEQMAPFAEQTAAQFEENDRLVILTTPRNMGDVLVVRKVIETAQGRPVVVINPRMSHIPVEMSEFDTVYLLKQFSVVQVKEDLRRMSKRSPIKISKAQRHQQHIECQLGQEIPRVFTYRTYPDDYKLYIDLDTKGFELIEVYERKPMAPTICLRAQIFIGQRQREVAMERQRDELKKREQERSEIFGDLSNGPSDEEIDALLRD